jgi:hypothetical protein
MVAGTAITGLIVHIEIPVAEERCDPLGKLLTKACKSVPSEI